MFDQAGSGRLVLDFEAVTLIDVTAARALGRLIQPVADGHARLSLARTRRAVLGQVRDAGLVEAIGGERFYPTVALAVGRARRALH